MGKLHLNWRVTQYKSPLRYLPKVDSALRNHVRLTIHRDAGLSPNARDSL